jgi:hypothetical protein
VTAAREPSFLLLGTDETGHSSRLRVELLQVGEASDRRVKEPKQAAWCAVVDVGPRLGHHAALEETFS